MVGNTILHYRLLEEIGAGGMGVVYLAEDEKLHRRVALKFVARAIKDDPDARERLLREARAASALNHPNIVSIHAIEETPEHVFIVMEHVQGESLHSLVKRGTMTWERVIELSRQIVSALGTAHEYGIVHRDIKSDNILLTPKGQIKVLDFGLARGRDATALITRVGSSAGTPAYMSPEQVQDAAVDHRSDLFSFGVVLYEMVTGRLPFKGEHEAALTYSIVNETPTAVRVHNQAVPESLQNVIAKLLQKNPRDRYQSTAELMSDLERARAGAPVKGPRRHLKLAPMIGVLAVVVAVGVVLFGRGRGPSVPEPLARDPDRKMLAVLPFENLGPTDQEYFADGVTEEITTRLAKLEGLGVISRTSAMQYKSSTKSLREIGKELGVDYALEGSVRWDKSGETSNVRISAQLIRINDDTHLWADTFDRVYGEIFVLQSEIAEKVADELNLTFLEPARAALASKPTENLDAYDLYLRGREAYEAATGVPELDAALTLVERAVALDSTFSHAQAYLARMYSNQYFNLIHRELPRLEQARTAALAALRHAPGQPQGHVAMGYYHYYGSRDYDRALQEFAVAQKIEPNNADVLEAMAYVQRRQGKWEEAVANLERSIDLNPRNVDPLGNLLQTYVFMRRWEDAERCIARGLATAPDNPLFQVWRAAILLVRDGNINGAIAAMEPLQAQVPQMAVFLFELDTMNRDYARAHTRVPSLNAYAGIDTIQYFLAHANAYHFAGNDDRARACYDSLRVMLESEFDMRTNDDPRILMGYAFALAALDRPEEARAHARRALDLMPLSKDALAGAELIEENMVLELMLGNHDRAIRDIERLQQIPSNLTPAVLRLHPGFDALRDDPRFKKIVEEKVSL